MLISEARAYPHTDLLALADYAPQEFFNSGLKIR
jgi:hypothetical protein